jgi:hypothetical protein
VTDFVNLKIMSAQSFGGAHKGMVYVCVFIGVNAHTYMNIYACISQKSALLLLSSRSAIMGFISSSKFCN